MHFTVHYIFYSLSKITGSHAFFNIGFLKLKHFQKYSTLPTNPRNEKERTDPMLELVQPDDSFNNSSDYRTFALLQQVNALFEGHFMYASGKHGDTYINKDALYAHPEETALVADRLVSLFTSTNANLGLGVDVDVVVGAPIGGVILAHYTANALQQHVDTLIHLFEIKHLNPKIRVAYPEKQTDNYEFKRGYDQHITGKKVLVVEDIVTTGTTLELVLQAVQNSGGEVVGCACIVNRTGKSDTLVQQQLQTPSFCSLIQMQTPTYSQHQCPLCQQGIPVNTTLGYGAKRGV